MSLAEAAPPADQTEGWKPDPLNPAKVRWWDGTTWTQRVGATRTVQVAPGTDTTNLQPKTDAERKAALAQRLQYLVNVDQCRIESQTDFQAVVVTGKRPNHLLHLILTLLTVGLWVFVWIGVAIFGGEKRRVVSVDDFGQVLG